MTELSAGYWKREHDIVVKAHNHLSRQHYDLRRSHDALVARFAELESDYITLVEAQNSASNAPVVNGVDTVPLDRINSVENDVRILTSVADSTADSMDALIGAVENLIEVSKDLALRVNRLEEDELEDEDEPVGESTGPHLQFTVYGQKVLGAAMGDVNDALNRAGRK